MSPSPRPFIRTTAGRLAVAGVAALASVSAVAPAAFADDTDLAPESTEQAPEPPATPVETPPAPEVDTPAGPDVDARDEPPAPVTKTESEHGSTETSAGTVTAQAEVVDEADEYGSQSIAVTVSRVPGAFYPASWGGSRTVYPIAQIYVGDSFVRSEQCVAELGLTATDPATVDCLFGGSPTLTLQPGERAELYNSLDGTMIDIQPCAASDCSPSAVPAAFTVDGPAPQASNYSSYRIFQGAPVTQDLLSDEWVGDPATTVRIVSGPENGTATLGSDGRTVTYTSAEDFDGTETITYELTNTNGTATGTWSIEVVDPMVPDFGSQKFRVGVRVASGAFVPAGTTTVGSTFEIVTTTEDGETETVTCTTVTPEDPDGSSFCPGTNPFGTRDLPAGSRAVITQTGAPEGQALLPDPDPIVIEPCDYNRTDSCPTVTALFGSPGSILPETRPDTATVDQGGEPIIVDVLANDTSEDPNTGLEVTPLPPEQGTIEVVGEAAAPTGETSGGVGILAVPSAGTLALRYTPPTGFSGEVPVRYAVTNSNGSTTETLTITVRPRGEVPVDAPTLDLAPATVDGASTTPVRAGTGASMPNAGGPASSLLGIGFLLAGLGAAILGRTRRKSPHTAGR